MNIFNWFRTKKSPIQLMKEREDVEFIEALKCMALEFDDGRVANHGLSEYGARKLLQEGREPGPLEQRVLMSDGTFMSFKDWKELNK